MARSITSRRIASKPGTPVSGTAWWSALTGPFAAAVVLALFWVLMLASVRNKSLTCDEIVHATAGYTYWQFNDYRLNPENGNLPQRVMALPLLLTHQRFPTLESEDWQSSDEWAMGDQWFHHLGNDVGALLFNGRAAMGLLAVALGALVWVWARRLFGPRGGMLALLLFVLNPTVLANGPLMTSDLAAALFFLASVGSLWRVLQRITIGRVLLSGLCVGGLFVSKMSALLIVPMALVLVAVRLIDGRPLPVALGPSREELRRSRQALIFVAVGVVHVLVVWDRPLGVLRLPLCRFRASPTRPRPL